MRTWRCPLCGYQFIDDEDSETDIKPICRVAQAYDMVRHAPVNEDGNLVVGDWWEVMMSGCRGEMVLET